MGKKFDVVIGNPPYNDDRIGESNSRSPIYPGFMDAAYQVGLKAVLITPARFLFNAGYTSSIWNKKMLSDPHLSVPIYVDNSDKLFPGTSIKGGVAVTCWDESKQLGPISVFTRVTELNRLIRMVAQEGRSLMEIVTKRDAYKYTAEMHEENPQASALMSKSAQFIVTTGAFDLLPFLFHKEAPSDEHEYVRIMGKEDKTRVYRWVRADFITGPESFRGFKVAISKANGAGAFGEQLASPVVLEPQVGVTQTYLTIGNFETKAEAEACLKYISSKFARALLSTLKVTQDNPSRVWEFVPLMDFSEASDIDWSKSISDIDRQLYAKYGLNAEEITFIENNVKSMS